MTGSVFLRIFIHPFLLLRSGAMYVFFAQWVPFEVPCGISCPPPSYIHTNTIPPDRFFLCPDTPTIMNDHPFGRSRLFSSSPLCSFMGIVIRFLHIHTLLIGPSRPPMTVHPLYLTHPFICCVLPNSPSLRLFASLHLSLLSQDFKS
jgi:hypothetical protein